MTENPMNTTLTAFKEINRQINMPTPTANIIPQVLALTPFAKYSTNAITSVAIGAILPKSRTILSCGFQFISTNAINILASFGGTAQSSTRVQKNTLIPKFQGSNELLTLAPNLGY